MIPEEYIPMLEKISELTKKRKKSWEKTSDMNRFILKVGLNAISLFSFTSYPDDEECIGFELLNTYGDRIDGFGVGITESEYSKMSELYSNARRNALKIDSAISNVMNDLDSILKS